MKIKVKSLDSIETFNYKVVAQGRRDEYGNRVLKEEVPSQSSEKDKRIENWRYQRHYRKTNQAIPK